MSLHRFYITPDHWNPEELVLLEEEAHHCHEVLRCKPGDKVAVFNGRGVEASAEIVETERRRVKLSCINVSKSEPLRARITLGQAIPKKKNMDLIVQKATELGTHRIAPILSERTVVRLDQEERRRKQAKWQRVALEASKQSGSPAVSSECPKSVSARYPWIACRTSAVGTQVIAGPSGNDTWENSRAIPSHDPFVNRGGHFGFSLNR